jgi:DNA polymerase-4
MDAFFASVEQRDHPELKGRPLIVAGPAESRGVVAAASYEARPFGIRSAMATAAAERLCPHLVRVTPRIERYREVSAQLHEIFLSYTELVEPISLDECFLDLTAHCASRHRSLTETAREIKLRIREGTGLTASAGGAPNKFLAKIASDLEKPDGLVIVPPNRVRAFLEPLPVERIWGVGPVTAGRLHELGIRTIADLARKSPAGLGLTFGRWGAELGRLAQGLDDRPVVPHHEPKSLSAENTFARDVVDPQTLLQEIADQATEVAARLKGHAVMGRTVTLKLRYADFTTITRSRTSSRPLEEVAEIRALAEGLLARTEFPERPVRLVGLGVSGLVDRHRPVQLELFDHEE